MKKIFLIILVIVLFLTLVGFGINGFGKMIYNSCDCERFNIDNIELRTGINIPSIIKEECTYDINARTKKASFIIDTIKVDLDDYIQKNKLAKSGSSELYIKSNDTENYSYEVLLDKKTKKLAVEITYKDR